MERRQLEVEKLRAQSVKVAADATYYKNQKLVQAGLTPQEKAELELNKAIGVAKEFSKMAVPGVIIQLGAQNGGDLTNALIQADMAKRIMNGTSNIKN